MQHLVIGLAHIGVKTKNSKKSVDFYKDVLGFQLYYSYKFDDGTALDFLRAGSCIIEIIGNPNFDDAVCDCEGTVAHVALEVLNIDAMIASLKAAGVDSWQSDAPSELPELFPTGSRNIFFKGPSGELIELFEYTTKKQ